MFGMGTFSKSAGATAVSLPLPRAQRLASRATGLDSGAPVGRTVHALIRRRTAGRGPGLLGMAERADQNGGTQQVRSAAGAASPAAAPELLRGTQQETTVA